MISGATRVAAVIGDPVRHSLSPILHNAAYRELGLDWRYVAFEVPDGDARAALDAVRTLGLVGLSVTMPHKTVVADAVDECAPAAAALRSVNTVTPRADGTLFGESTDGEGFLRAVAECGHALSQQAVLVLGAGDAARAVVHALGSVGANVTVAARRDDAAKRAAALAGGGVAAWGERDRAAATASVIVNATPVGMGDDAGLPVPVEVLVPGQVVVDLVYHPLETPILRAARARGVEVVDGLGMLVHQATLQVERWAERPAPVAAMRAAAIDRLSRSQP